MITTTGAQFKAFSIDPEVFLKDTYTQNLVLYVNGEELTSENEINPCYRASIIETIPDDAEIVLVWGNVVHGISKQDLFEVFSNWVRRRNTSTLTVEVPTENVSQLLASLKAAGAKVLQRT